MKYLKRFEATWLQNCCLLLDHAGTLRDKLITTDPDCGFQCSAAPPDRVELLSAQHQVCWRSTSLETLQTCVYFQSNQACLRSFRIRIEIVK